MFPLPCLLSLVPKFLCELGFRTGTPPVPRRPLSVVYSCELAASAAMGPVSLLNKISIHHGY